MSFGKLTSIITIVSTTPRKDAEGFAINGDTILANVRVYKEDRHGNTAWKNRAAFSTATSLFRFRVIPDLTVTPAMVIICNGERYSILSVEDVRGRGMYLEALTEGVTSRGAV